MRIVAASRARSHRIVAHVMVLEASSVDQEEEVSSPCFRERDLGRKTFYSCNMRFCPFPLSFLDIDGDAQGITDCTGKVSDRRRKSAEAPVPSHNVLFGAVNNVRAFTDAVGANEMSCRDSSDR